MPTEEALAKLKEAEEQLKGAEGALQAFIERSTRDFSDEERAENMSLIDVLQQSIAGYWEAYEEAKRSS